MYGEIGFGSKNDEERPIQVEKSPKLLARLKLRDENSLSPNFGLPIYRRNVRIDSLIIIFTSYVIFKKLATNLLVHYLVQSDPVLMELLKVQYTVIFLDIPQAYLVS
jgi:hypothetical protein